MKFVALACLLVLAGCASTQYRPYEGAADIQGTGGARSVVEGVDFWTGTPPRKFRVLGLIDDTRPGGPLPMASLKGDIARKAKEAGGDGVLEVGSEMQLAGFVNTAGASAQTIGTTTTAYGSGVSMPARRHTSRYAVIKYLD